VGPEIRKPMLNEYASQLTLELAAFVASFLGNHRHDQYADIVVEIGKEIGKKMCGNWKRPSQKILHARQKLFSSVYFCVPTKHKILYQEYRDRKRQP